MLPFQLRARERNDKWQTKGKNVLSDNILAEKIKPNTNKVEYLFSWQFFAVQWVTLSAAVLPDVMPMWIEAAARERNRKWWAIVVMAPKLQSHMFVIMSCCLLLLRVSWVSAQQHDERHTSWKCVRLQREPSWEYPWSWPPEYAYNYKNVSQLCSNVTLNSFTYSCLYLGCNCLCILLTLYQSSENVLTQINSL